MSGGRRWRATGLCRHCGRPPFGTAAELVEAATYQRSSAAEPAADDRERELWAAVDEADRIRAAAPSAPGRADLVRARDAVLHALAVGERVARHVWLVEEALRRPGSWLRPVQRLRLVGQLQARRAAEEAAREQVDRAQAGFAELRRQAAARRNYLAAHEQALAVGRAARAELDRLVDELIDGYLRMPRPPAWLGYPPPPDQHAEWLRRAREEVASRRRYGAGAPRRTDPVND